MQHYLDTLQRLQTMDIAEIVPAHGPTITDPQAKIAEYIAHRLDRERRLLDALAAGRRGVDELLDQVWDDVPAALRPAAAITLRAHLDKLRDEGRLPAGVELPQAPPELTA